MNYINTISNWYGRLGNNIQQICNGILFSKVNGDGFFSPEHNLIEQVAFECSRSDKVRANRFFHYDTENVDFHIDVPYIFNNIREIAIEYIFPNLKVKPDKIFGDDTLVIHIRSGDIFEHEHNPPHDYTPNPLCYYLNLIEEYDNIVVVTEPDDYNPIIKELGKIKKVSIQSKSVGEDFATLMSAKNIASSGTGTFAVAAALCSKNIQNFYCTNLYLTEHLNPEMLMGTDVKVYMMYLDNYIRQKTWKNNKEQRKFILEYKNEGV